MGTAFILLEDIRKAREGVDVIIRNPYGGGSKTEELEVTIDGEKAEPPIAVTVGEVQYTDQELEAVFERAIQELESAVLGENDSLDEIHSDMYLLTEIPGEPIEVEWQLDRYDVINIYGELNPEALAEEEEGALVHLKAFLHYTEDVSKQAVHEMTARLYPPVLSGTEKFLAEIQDVISENETKYATEETVKLPSELDGKKIIYHVSESSKGPALLSMGIIICVLFWLLEKQDDKKYAEKKKRQMMRDYPEIINKLTLLLGAGMTAKSAWYKIVADYEKQRAYRGKSPAYEEMAAVYHEMQSGVAETECYEHFGKRCGLKAYRKLGALLSQNLRKGTKGLTELLRIEAIQAFEERKALARRRGEEAGTRLLIPMVFMLGVVLVIVIVPAFLSIRF